MTAVLLPNAKNGSTNELRAAASANVWPLPDNLALDFDRLSELLDAGLEHRAWVDAFAVAALINQTVEDFLHRDPLPLAKCRFEVAEPSSGLGTAARTGLASVRRHLKNRSPGTARLIRWQRDFAAFVLRLAEMVVCPAIRPCVAPEELLEVCGLLLAEPDVLPAQLGRELCSPVAPFRNFAERREGWQQPLSSFLADPSRRRRRLLVVGIRPSGSCLAPLVAAHLGLQGCEDIGVMTLRAGERLLPCETAEIHETARKRGLVMVTDETATSQAMRLQIAETLVCEGSEAGSILLLSDLPTPPAARPLPSHGSKPDLRPLQASFAGAGRRPSRS